MCKFEVPDSNPSLPTLSQVESHRNAALRTSYHNRYNSSAAFSQSKQTKE